MGEICGYDFLLHFYSSHFGLDHAIVISLHLNHAVFLYFEFQHNNLRHDQMRQRSMNEPTALHFSKLTLKTILAEQ